MTFPSEEEAKDFLIDKIAARAIAEGSPLSDFERRMLAFSESTLPIPPDTVSGSHDFEEDFEWRMAGLLKSAHEQDSSSDSIAREQYRDAFAALGRSDHYVNWIAKRAGLGPPPPAWLRFLREAALLGLLVLPALVAIVIAAAGFWAAVGQPSRDPWEAVGVSVVGLVFSLFAVYLLGLWLKMHRA